MDSLDVESKKTAAVEKEINLGDSKKTSAQARLNAQATANYISIMSRQKGLLAESSQRTLTVLSSNLNTYLKEAGALDAIEDDKDSAQLGHYRKLTVQVINRDQSLQEKVAQDLSTSGQLVRSRDAATTLEKNLKNLPPSLNEGTPAGKNLNKLICQSVVNLTDYENMGAGLQRDLSIREVYPPSNTLSLRSKIATQDALTASIAYVKSNQPEVLATLKNSLEVVKTKPGTSTPQIMTRYLRKALDEFPNDSTYLDIFKQNRQKADESKEYQDEISRQTAKRIQTLIHKAADTARRGNLLPEPHLAEKGKKQPVNTQSATVAKDSSALKDASTLTLSELSDRAAKLQQKFREERIRMAQEGKLPDPAARNSAISKEDVARLDSGIDTAMRSGDLRAQSPQGTPKSETLTPEDVKKLALDAIREVLKETAKAQLELTQNAAKETATQVAEVLKESVRSQLEATQNNALLNTSKAIEELKATVRSELEASHNSTRETTDKVVAELRESVKNELEASKNSNLENTSKVVAELKDAVKSQLEASKSSLESTTKVVEELKETVKKELESSKTTTLENTSKVVEELKNTVQKELEATKNSSLENTSKVVEELKNTVQKQLEATKNSSLENTSKVVEELRNTVQKQLEATKNSSLENTSKVVEELKNTVQKQLEDSKNNSLVNTSKIVEDLKETVKNHLEQSKNSAQEVASQVAEELRKTVKSQLESQQNTNKMNVDRIAAELKNSVKAQLELSQSTAKDMTDKALKELLSSFKSENSTTRENTPAVRNNALNFAALNQNEDAEFSLSGDPLKLGGKSDEYALNTRSTADLVHEKTISKVTHDLNTVADTPQEGLKTPLLQTDDDNALLKNDKAAEVSAPATDETAKISSAQDERAREALHSAQKKGEDVNLKEENVPKDAVSTRIIFSSGKTMAEHEADIEKRLANAPLAYPKDIAAPRNPLKDEVPSVATLIQNDNILDEERSDSSAGQDAVSSAKSTITYTDGEEPKANTIISRTSPNTAVLDEQTKLADSIPTEVLLRDTSDESTIETVNQFASRFTTASGIGTSTPVVPGSTDTPIPNTAQGLTLEEKALAESQMREQKLAQSSLSESVDYSTAADDTPILNPDNDSFDEYLNADSKTRAARDSAEKARMSVWQGLTSAHDSEMQAGKAPSSENSSGMLNTDKQSLGQRILANTIPEDELSDSVIPKDVKDAKLLKENAELVKGEKKDGSGAAATTAPSTTLGAAAVTSGQSEPIPDKTVIDSSQESKDKIGFFGKLASFFKKTDHKELAAAERNISTRESNSASANLMALATKDSPLNALTHALKVQMNNANLPSIVRDQARNFLKQLENPINDLPSVQNWLSFTSSPMSPSSSLALALHQWAFTLLSIRFAQLGKSVDKFLKKKISLYDEPFDEELNDIKKLLKDGSRGSISGLLNDTMDQIQRFQKPQKEELPALYQYVPLPPARDGGHEGAFNARPVIEEDGVRSWHLTFVFDLENLGPIEIKAVAKFPQVKLNVVTSTFEGLKKIQECMPYLRERLQHSGLTTTNATARLGTVHFRDDIVPPQTDGTRARDDENVSVDI